MTVAITGAGGFIGSHLWQVLEKSGHDLVRFEGDLRDLEATEAFFKDHPGIDQVVHLVGSFLGEFKELLELNVHTTHSLLSACASNGVKKVVYTSTGAVYGEPAGSESKESDPLKPNTLYGLSKQLGEEVVQYYGQNTSLNFVILRFPNVYGEGGGKGVVHSFQQAIKERGVISLHGDGTQSRNFLHVRDACLGIELALKHEGSGIFNISNPTKLSLNDVIEHFKKKYEFTIERTPADNNLKDLILNIDKARKELGFEPQITELQV